jgi:hypothetical protein
LESIIVKYDKYVFIGEYDGYGRIEECVFNCKIIPQDLYELGVITGKYGLVVSTYCYDCGIKYFDKETIYNDENIDIRCNIDKLLN